MSEDLPLLREMLREAERGLDQQLRALEELDDKSEQILAVALAVAGAGLAAFAYAHDKADAGRLAVFRLLFGAGFALNLAAGLAFLTGYLGLVHPTVAVGGPAPSWLASKANDADWVERDHLINVVRSHAAFFENNARIQRQVRRATVLGCAVLGLAVASYLGASFYVL